ncbi:MAG TPA: GAF and ANTAR domain-containing protein [Solirubrobacteraceae bacterium]|nr:GAF and ANTAR domain-containing protein [Solirubrobacteraceae bacterium]
MAALKQVLAASHELIRAAGSGIMLVDDESALSAVAATDEAGRRLEVVQQQAGHGPCVDALTFDRTVTSTDLATDERWPMLVPELPDAGVRAVLGVPLHVDRVPVGSLNIYRDHPHDWSESELSALRAYSSLVEGLLGTALRAREREQLAEQLQHALNNRVIIERAVGVIMSRENVDTVTAFNILRRRARSSQRRVADVASELLAAIPGNPD